MLRTQLERLIPAAVQEREVLANPSKSTASWNDMGTGMLVGFLQRRTQMPIKLRGLAGVALSGLLMACTPAENAETSPESEAETTASSGMPEGMADMSGPQTPFTPSEDRMHQRMMQAAGADVQETYALKMIEHHRGAIEMSQVVLQHNPDPELRAMAEETITGQGQEITMLERWVAAHRASGADTTAAPPQRAD